MHHARRGDRRLVTIEHVQIEIGLRSSKNNGWGLVQVALKKATNKPNL